MASEQEGKSIGDIFRESFQKGMDQAREKRERNRVGEVLAADRGLPKPSAAPGEARGHRRRQCGRDDRDELATEIEVWQALYDDWREGKS